MFSLGEMLILAVLALVFIGPKDLPQVARVIGKFLAEMKHTAGEFTSSIMDARNETQNNLMNEQKPAEVKPIASEAVHNENVTSPVDETKKPDEHS